MCECLQFQEYNLPIYLLCVCMKLQDYNLLVYLLRVCAACAGTCVRTASVWRSEDSW